MEHDKNIQLNHIFDFFADKRKIAIYKDKPYLEKPKYPNIEQVTFPQFNKLKVKFDLIILKGFINTASYKKLYAALNENGKIVILLDGSCAQRFMQWINFKWKSKQVFTKKQSIEGGYLLPNLNQAHQLVSMNKTLSKQYFQKYYHWSYTNKDSIGKRCLKQIIYALNAFVLVEQNQLLWVCKNDK